MSRTNEHDEVQQPDDMARRLSGLMVRDILQATTYLRERRDVGRNRVALLGYSMGSFVTSLACAIDVRVNACVLVGGGDLDGPGGYWDSSGNKMCQAIPYRSLERLGDRGAAIYALQADHAHTLVLNGSADTVVDIPNHGEQFFKNLQERAKARSHGQADRIFSYQFVEGGGHEPYFLTRLTALWLEHHLQFPNWTDESIYEMREVKVSNWAARYKVVDSNLANELNEGGTIALDNEIFPLTRYQLESVPEAKWDAEAYRYVYESWLTAAQSATRSGGF